MINKKNFIPKGNYDTAISYKTNPSDRLILNNNNNPLSNNIYIMSNYGLKSNLVNRQPFMPYQTFDGLGVFNHEGNKTLTDSTYKIPFNLNAIDFYKDDLYNKIKNINNNNNDNNNNNKM